ncbi:MAG TPA: M14 family metallopeptidase [Thermoanaerobaculia bacterium]|nr:M14 family metallopeptidase [Thermoanaerobaculia bacterium]
MSTGVAAATAAFGAGTSVDGPRPAPAPPPAPAAAPAPAASAAPAAAAPHVAPASAIDVPREWLTPAEAAGFEATPDYEETMAFLRRLAGRLPEMRLESFGRSAAGRPLPLVIVSRERAFTAVAARRLAKPIVLIQNGIHPGEIDGKDACLMILRDLALGRRRGLLDDATLLIVPIYNVDGHERISPYNRPNQDGPHRGMGFRTNAAGLDLNRDYVKAASPEAQALVGLIAAWRPHLFVDNHVTDGVDHDWVLTWSWAEAPQLPAPVDAWMRERLPAALAATERAGHATGPYVDLKDPVDPAKGFSSWVGQPRFSSGYFPLRNRPAVLVETLSYKPYAQRVLATRDFLLALLAEVGRDPAGLTGAVAAAEAATVAAGAPHAAPSDIVVNFEESPAADRIRLPLYATEIATSQVTGRPLLRYRRGEVRPLEVPWYHGSRAALTLPRPRGYLVMPGWPQIEQRLRIQGLRVEQLAEAAEIDVETMRLGPPHLADASYQGLIHAGADVTRRTERRRLPAGTLWVPADQPDFAVAVQLLEPEAGDSLLSWGLLSTIWERKEYISPWVLEDQAARLLQDPRLAGEWQRALADPKLAGDPQARYLWWFQRTPYWDETVGLMPCFRLLAAPSFKTRPWPP